MAHKKKLTRRTILRGVAAGSAVTVGLPLFDSMFNANGTALAEGGAIPRRFGVFFWGNGVIPERWTPSATGASWELSEELAPLAEVKDYLNIVTGTDIKTPSHRGHHNGCVGVLSGAEMIPQDPGSAGYASTFRRPSVDQIVADQIAGDSRFRSLEYGVYSRVTSVEGTTLRYLSHNGPDDINPPEYSPRGLFNTVFGEEFRAPDDSPEVDPRIGLRRSVLDAVIADANALKLRLGESDRIRLDQHLSGIRQLEMQLARLEENEPAPYLASCARPELQEDPQDGVDQRPRNKFMSDVMAMALACDQTRVFSNMFSGSVAGGTRFPGCTTGHHPNTHDEGAPWEEVHVATVYIMECLKDMLVSLREVPEGDGNLLDNCAILASTDLSWDHSYRDYPIIIAGGACGALKTPGSHYRSGGQNTSDAVLTVARAAAPELESFGFEDGLSTSTISEIEG